MTSHPNASQPDRRLRGVTLIEAVLYIAIALALIVGGLLFYQQASVASRTNYIARVYAALLAETRVVAGEVASLNAMNFEEYLHARGSVPEGLWDATKPSGERLRFPSSGMSGQIHVTLLPSGMSLVSLWQERVPISMCGRLSAAERRNTIYGNGAFIVYYWDDAFSPASEIHHFTIFPTLTVPQAGIYCRNVDSNKNGLVKVLMVLQTFD
jgi:hypothetical protein